MPTFYTDATPTGFYGYVTFPTQMTPLRGSMVTLQALLHRYRPYGAGLVLMPIFYTDDTPTGFYGYITGFATQIPPLRGWIGSDAYFLHR